MGRLFSAVGDALEQNRSVLNRADPLNGNHGDHMAAIFQVAAQAARENPDLELPQAMQAAAERLAALPANDSARLYAVGLGQMSRQFQSYGITTSDLVSYVRSVLAEKPQPGAAAQEKPENAGDILKALMAGLAAWSRMESGQPPSDNPLDMGTLFEFGLAYMQAKQRGGNRLQVLADAACAVSPLGLTPHRTESGRIAIQALLQAMQA